LTRDCMGLFRGFSCEALPAPKAICAFNQARHHAEFPTGGADPLRMKLWHAREVVGTEVGISLVR
jgi:hypothetical protein